MDKIEKIEVFLGSRPFKGDAKEIGWRAELNTPGVHPGTDSLGPQEVSKRLRELANHIDLETRPVPPDPNMHLALSLACHLVPTVLLPSSIAGMTPDQLADLVEIVDKEPLRLLPVSSDDFEWVWGSRAAQRDSARIARPAPYPGGRAEAARIARAILEPELSRWGGVSCHHPSSKLALARPAGPNVPLFSPQIAGQHSNPARL